MEEDVDHVAGFVAATFAPALLAGLIALPFLGPIAVMVFVIAFVISMAHVLFLAAPLYALISQLWRPGPATVLILAPLIGGAPATILAHGDMNAGSWLFALCGFLGGCAFLVFAHRMRVNDGY